MQWLLVVDPEQKVSLHGDSLFHSQFSEIFATVSLIYTVYKLPAT